jgi:excinuclease ABC subunit C
MASETITAKLPHLPDTPGCYLFKDRAGKVLYVGKARVLKNRVRTYFQPGARHDAKTEALLKKVSDYDILVTDNEMEALILEANLVREYKPRYNINLKDDKRYPYLKVTTNEPFPRLLVVRRVGKDSATYFGPYTNVKAMRRTVKLISRVFMIRSCNLVIPPPKGRSYRVCLDYFIKRCPGPCEFKIAQDAYGELIKGACLFLAGRSRELFDTLRTRMAAAAEEEHFEEAAQLRDQLTALESVVEKQKVSSDDGSNRDILAFDREARDAVVIALQIRDGILIGRQHFHLVADKSDTPESIVTAFIKQYYLDAPLLPDEIYLPVAIEDADLIGGWLREKKGNRVALHHPQRGQKVRLVQMAQENARQVLQEILLQKRGSADRVASSVAALGEAIMLEKPPLTIAAFDISNLGGREPVASCVFFDNAKPVKSEYRHFNVKAGAPDDFAAMREVVGRYVKRRVADQKPLPDLLLIDGGRGQLSSAAEALHEAGIEDQPMIGLAKRLDEIVFPYQSETLMLPRTSPALHLIQRIRDEAHRFANTFQRKKRAQRTVKSQLDGIAGIGPSRRDALLQHFGSVTAIQQAGIIELTTTPGMTRRAALALWQFMHPGETAPELPKKVS